MVCYLGCITKFVFKHLLPYFLSVLQAMTTYGLKSLNKVAWLCRMCCFKVQKQVYLTVENKLICLVSKSS